MATLTVTQPHQQYGLLTRRTARLNIRSLPLANFKGVRRADAPIDTCPMQIKMASSWLARALSQNSNQANQLLCL